MLISTGNHLWGLQRKVHTARLVDDREAAVIQITSISERTRGRTVEKVGNGSRSSRQGPLLRPQLPDSRRWEKTCWLEEAQKLVGSEFSPNTMKGWIHGWRCRGGDIYLADFGPLRTN